MTTLLEDATLNWYKATLRWKTAKEALRQFRQDNGSCPREKEVDKYGETAGECFRSGGDINTWCEVCQASQPLYRSFRKAAIDMGVALQALRRWCKVSLGNEGAQ